ncbi:MAG TPA: NUDIX domain-containing protein [Trebonia sp.]|nr:NUDIX domain-containing protein [Trebonia sp.]
MDSRVIPCVGAVIKDSGGRLLLIKRGHEPGKGRWSVPGGRIEPGETDQEALVRETREETGLIVAPGSLIGAVRRPAGPPGAELDIRDYAAAIVGGELAAGDDADAVMWAGPRELGSLPMADGLLDALREWGAI